MQTYKLPTLVEYFPLVLIFSYFFIHSIIPVLIGITFSLYLLNLNSIQSSLRLIYKALSKRKVDIEVHKKVKDTKIESVQPSWNKEDSSLTLVEKIEELGFIPSQDENNDIHAA